MIKKGSITVNKMSVVIWNASWSLRKLYGCRSILVVKENRSRVTRMTVREVSVKRTLSLCIRLVYATHALRQEVILKRALTLYTVYMLMIEVTKGEEVIEKVTRIIKDNKIKQGSLSLVGAVDSCCISTMPKTDAKKDILTEYHEPLELLGTGEIVAGSAHIHVTLGREGKSTLMGHLHWGKVDEWFVHVYVTPV
jgi:predicted DNA-binding protein with PD1-like motif